MKSAAFETQSLPCFVCFQYASNIEHIKKHEYQVFVHKSGIVSYALVELCLFQNHTPYHLL